MVRDYNSHCCFFCGVIKGYKWFFVELEMEKEKIKERVLQWQLLADQWFNENQKVFIKTWNGDLHFCKIVMVGETKISVDNYAPEQRAGTRDYIDWLNIQIFDKVREEGE